MATSLRNKQHGSVEPDSDWKAKAKRRTILVKLGTTALAAALLAIFLMPMAYAFITSLKTAEQSSDPEAPILPSQSATFEYEGKEYDVLAVDIDGETRNLAIVKPGRQAERVHRPGQPRSRNDRLGRELEAARSCP